MSLLAGGFFILPQYAIQLIDKLHQLARIHFFTRLFGKVFPIAR